MNHFETEPSCCGTHGVLGEFRGPRKKATRISTGTGSKPGPAGGGEPSRESRRQLRGYPEFACRPRTPQKDTLAAKISYTPAGFLFIPSPQCALGTRETRKKHIPGGALRASSPALGRQGSQLPRSCSLPRLVAPRSVPPSLPGHTLRRANSARGGRSGIPGPPFWDPFSSARARANYQATAGSQGFRSPLDQQRVLRPGRWAAARAPAPCPRAPFSIQAPACPRSQPRKRDEP